jgi:hypothetical protein
VYPGTRTVEQDESVPKRASRPSSFRSIPCKRLPAATTLSRQRCQPSAKLPRIGSEASRIADLLTPSILEPA